MTIQRCVLIIDDDYRLREVTRMTLELMAGWQILGAESGQVGLEMARSRQPDAILLDLMMPEMDGLATLYRLRADPATADIPAILLTAKGSPRDLQDLQDLPVSALIAKPFDTFHLAEQIAHYLGWSEPALQG